MMQTSTGPLSCLVEQGLVPVSLRFEAVSLHHCGEAKAQLVGQAIFEGETAKFVW